MSPPTTPPTPPISVLFVCLGNICRSPMAEGVFTHTITQHSLTHLISRIDSCGTSRYHLGSPPDPRTQQTLRAHGITGYRHAARQLTDRDFTEFDYIFCMDRENERAVLQRRPAGARARVGLFGAWAEGEEEGREVEDPYYGGAEGFEENYGLLVRCARGFVRRVLGVGLE